MSAIHDSILYPIPKTGPVEIIRNKILKDFDGTIVQSRSEFRLHAPGLALTLHSADALYIIEELKMVVEKSPLMTSVVLWKVFNNKQSTSHNDPCN